MKNKRKETCLNLYGYDFPAKVPEIKEYDWINNNEYEKLRIKEIIENKLLFKNNY